MTATTVRSPEEARGAYRDMLVRLMTRQFYAETATAEVFGRSIACAPNLREKFLAAEFAHEEADHSARLCKLLKGLGYMRECGLKFPPLAAFAAVGAELMPSSREIILSNQ